MKKLLNICMLALLALPISMPTLYACDVIIGDDEAKTAANLNSAIAAASISGKNYEICMADGTWDLTTDLAGQIIIPASQDGNATYQFVLRPQTAGGVTLTGEHHSSIADDFLIKVYGDYWIIRDFKFIDVTYDAADSLLYNCNGIRVYSDRVQITNNYFEGWAKDSTASTLNNWIIWVGDSGTSPADGVAYANDNEIGHNTIKDSKAMVISITGQSGDRGVSTRIHHNAFEDLWRGSDTNGAGHCGQIGSDYSNSVDIGTLVEYNYIHATADFTGEMDGGFHNKGAGTIFRHNVVVNDSAAGQLNQMGNRGGFDALYDSNFFFRTHGNGNFYGEDITIKNNYFDSVQYGAINISEADMQSYEQVERMLVANNTIVGVTYRGILISWPDNPAAWNSGTSYTANLPYCGSVVQHNGEEYCCILSHSNQEPPNATYWQKTLRPDDITIINNIIKGAPGSGYYLVHDYGHTNGTYADNILYDSGGNSREWGYSTSGPNAGVPEPSGFAHYDPALVLRNGIYGLPSSDNGTYNANVAEDIHNTVRSNPPDKGCQECCSESVTITIDSIIAGAGHDFAAARTRRPFMVIQ